ncbi:MAG TPA: hypothetical protein VH853_21480 [Polyangia bacterium]|jgi:hypothetical protein|nr:hypothetical protein [Polyangia bacterium]
MRIQIFTSSLSLLAAVAVAHADPKLPPGSAHDPPVFQDQSVAWMTVVSRDSHYGAHGWFRVYGATNKNDGLTMVWRSGAKILGEGPCQTNWNHKHKTLAGDCSVDKDLTAAGPVEVDLVYRDDQTDKKYLVTTFKLTVYNWKGIGKTHSWGILPDDLLAVAFVRHWRAEDAAHNVPLFEFWSSNSGKETGGGMGTFRCTVGDTKLPDFDAHFDRAHSATQQYEIESSYTTPKEHREFTYEHEEIDPGFHFGAKDPSADPNRFRWVIDNPGDWDCFLRREGHVVREFVFKVDDKGMIQASELQSGKHPLPTPDNVALIDMKIPKENGIETRLRPDALKKSIGFGQPWPDGPNAKALQAAFPPAIGKD